MSARGFVVAGPGTGVGKTTVSVGLMRAFRRVGRDVQPFKVGPDFIDPTHHEAACGRCSHNLDGWMLDRATVRELFERHAEEADLAIVEGVMGLFDGAGAEDGRATTATMSRWLGLPVVLVVDCWRLGGSVAPLVHGFATFDDRVEIAGVILNRTAGRIHEEQLREALDGVAGGTVLGSLPKTEAFEVPERHLGLQLADEESLGRERLDRLAEEVEDHVDLRAIEEASAEVEVADGGAARTQSTGVRIGVARDRAFQFYYQDNLDRLERAGAELESFSPLAGEWPERLDGLYLGGGYPELAAERLAERRDVLDAIRTFSEANGPVYAECGGLMLLGDWLETREGERHRMAGVFPWTTRVEEYPRMDYAEVEIAGGGDVWASHRSVRGHEFHYSRMVDEPSRSEVDRIYEVHPLTGEAHREGYAVRRTLASYVHLHFGSHPELAGDFVAACRAYREERGGGSDPSKTDADADRGS